MFKDEDTRNDELNLNANLRGARISAVIMSVLIAFNLFCALSPFNLELVGIVLVTVYLFVYIKFSIVCGELKDLGCKRLWITLYRTVGLTVYLVSTVLCMLGIG